jgi:hypothetical protein
MSGSRPEAARPITPIIPMTGFRMPGACPPTTAGGPGMRSYISRETTKGRRKWQGQGEQQAVYQNRRGCGASMARVYCRRRGELVESSFARYDTGGMQRTYCEDRRIL